MKKRKDGRYSKQITVGIKNGKPVKKTVYGKTLKELDKNYRDMMSLIDKGVIIDNQSVTISKLIDEWYRLRLQGKIKTNSTITYTSFIKRIKQGIGDVKVRDTSVCTIENFIDDIKNEGCIVTAKNVLIILKSLFEYAIQNDIILKNPCRYLTVKITKTEKRLLTEEEKKKIDKLNTSSLSEKEKLIVLILRYTGMRKGELFALHKSDIDKKNMLITINKTLIDNKGRPFIQESPKSSAGIRKIPIFLPLSKPLFNYIDNLDRDQLFLNNNDNLISSNSMKLITNKIIKCLGLGTDVTMHSFRHNFISECYMAGVDIKRLQAWVGHSDIRTTLNIYAKLDKEYATNAEDMNKYYGSQTEVKSVKNIV